VKKKTAQQEKKGGDSCARKKEKKHCPKWKGKKGEARVKLTGGGKRGKVIITYTYPSPGGGRKGRYYDFSYPCSAEGGEKKKKGRRLPLRKESHLPEGGRREGGKDQTAGSPFCRTGGRKKKEKGAVGRQKKGGLYQVQRGKGKKEGGDRHQGKGEEAPQKGGKDTLKLPLRKKEQPLITREKRKRKTSLFRPRKKEERGINHHLLRRGGEGKEHLLFHPGRRKKGRPLHHVGKKKTTTREFFF